MGKIDHAGRSRQVLMRIATVVRSGGQNVTGCLSRSDRDMYQCHDGPENVTYWAVAFTGSEPEFEQEKG
ncbi:hypothetical protein Taro_050619 [Colocasia esculenta]|uniref:Uncharacterized protein n=1 Tax=Colocasia esculenta TaxID=4460 RepID=A0A843XEH9_COLES|nr:hypothetical protein [Colocasia esculenta]